MELGEWEPLEELEGMGIGLGFTKKEREVGRTGGGIFPVLIADMSRHRDGERKKRTRSHWKEDRMEERNMG